MTVGIEITYKTTNTDFIIILCCGCTKNYLSSIGRNIEKFEHCKVC